jgi:hypothetical protein
LHWKLLAHLARGLARFVDAPNNEVTLTRIERLALELGATQLREAREELARADGKASILLAATGVAAGAILGGALSAGWSPGQLGDPWAIAWVGGFASVMAGAGCLVMAVYPRWKRGRTDEAEALYFFGHAAKLKSAGEIRQGILQAAQDPLLRTADQLMHVSRIIERKYGWLSKGIWLLGAGTSITITATVASNVIGH